MHSSLIQQIFTDYIYYVPGIVLSTEEERRKRRKLSQMMTNAMKANKMGKLETMIGNFLISII